MSQPGVLHTPPNDEQGRSGGDPVVVVLVVRGVDGAMQEVPHLPFGQQINPEQQPCGFVLHS